MTLLGIYKSMLEVVRSKKHPQHIEFCYNIDEMESKDFWTNSSLKEERDILFKEWNPDGPSRYKKTFYGVKFAIQFNNGK